MSAPRGDGTQIRSLILTRTEISALMRPPDWLAAVETGFRAAGEGRVDAPPPLAIHGSGGVFHAKAAGLRGARHYVALKLNANFPGNPRGLGLPTIQGAILLCDGETGAVLAIMDSIEVTLRRTAAATAVAARYLARQEAASILICGCGAQSAAQLEALREVRPLTHCFAWDRDPERACAFAATASSEGLLAEAASDLATAAPASDIIVTCTTSRRAFLDLGMVRPGTFVAAVGADSPEKSEITPRLMASAKVVADVLDQCVVMGDLQHAIAAGSMTREAVHGELAELVSGVKPGRTSADEIIIFDSTGTGLQDVAAAAMIYERAAGDGHRPGVALAA
jgi:ornithine cyclodeaminase/alanine dehydrogenase-like protein (mu-crystallin family)